VLRAVVVQDAGPGLSGDEHAGAGVPGLVAELDAGIERFLRSASSPKAYWSIEIRASAIADV